MRSAAAFAVLASLAACATPAAEPAAALETITIDEGHISAVCAGFCTSFSLTVRSDEHVEAVRRPVYPGGDERDRVRRWRGRPGDFARTRAALAAIRPEGVAHDGPPCNDGEVPCNPDRPYRFILRWEGPDGSAALHSNARAYDETFCRIERAMADLGFSRFHDRIESRRGQPLGTPCDATLGGVG